MGEGRERQTCSKAERQRGNETVAWLTGGRNDGGDTVRDEAERR